MFVVSDIHAISNRRRYHVSAARTFGGSDPRYEALAAVREIVDRHAITADVLLCPGDVTDGNDKGPDRDGLVWGWASLLGLAVLLRARIAATAGNHDIFRVGGAEGDLGADPAKFLKQLRPPFPTGCAADSEQYFSNDFVVTRGTDWQVVSLNTCAEHDIDHERGSIRYETIDRIADEITAHAYPINVLQCHHHPVQWTHLNRSDRDHMRLGERLLNMLDLQDSGRWVIVHGHRHIPAVGYVGESTSGPVRFSAGSVSCALLPDIGIAARNQFYLLEFAVDEIQQLDLPGAGLFTAWDWIPTLGAREASSRWALPHRGGFGYRRTGHELAERCRRLAEVKGRRWLSWDELVEDEPRLKYVAPVDLRAMVAELERGAGTVLFSGSGTIEEIHVGPR